MWILAFNCGSSSLKFELLQLDARGLRQGVSHTGKVEEIGPNARAEFAAAPTPALTSHPEAARFALGWLKQTAPEPMRELGGVVHRVVHGGTNLWEPALIDDAVMSAIEQAGALAPLHNPPALETIRAVGQQLPDTPAVVVTDTGFHRTLPSYAFTYPLARELSARHAIRRYGFHGIGHSYMAQRWYELAGRQAQGSALITLHLGAGCSVCAIRDGCSVDTSMGMTPLEGLMMATRAGDLDPAIPGFLIQREQLSPAALDQLLNHRAGLLGVSAVSGDLREVMAAAADGNREAKLAVDIFCYRARKYIGAYLAVLGRADAIVFGGGIGENAAPVRAQICSGLENLGIALDPELNQASDGGDRCISAPTVPIQIWIIPLDEELQMARAALALLTPSHLAAC
ncbi:MAG TPA: acetate/propionate family kinase [Candidatus Binataceae bacterium]|nr:acetate/propionate family kinase [Candidatus Binataceae bacterium]